MPAPQPSPIIESTERTESRGDKRKEASAQITTVTWEGEHNEGASTSAKEKASKQTETGKRNEKEGDMPEEATIEMPAAGEKKTRAAKQRLVSYSSQNSESDTASRKSSRKRTAVIKIGGVMIDSITRFVKKKKMSKRSEYAKNY